MFTLKQIAAALNGRISGDWVVAPALGHSPKDDSLHVQPNAAVRYGFVIALHAAGASEADKTANREMVREKLGVPKANGTTTAPHSGSSDDIAAMLRSSVASQKPKGKIVATYDYRDRDGTLLYSKLRFEPKRFMYRLPDGSHKGPPEDRRVVYRLGDLLQFPSAEVFITEGEKDADNIAALDLCATTAASGKWTEECLAALVDRKCWIIQDCDEPGKKKAVQLAELLLPLAASIKIVALPGLTGEKDLKDVSDWLNIGHTKDELINVCIDTRDWVPSHVITSTIPEPADETETAEEVINVPATITRAALPVSAINAALMQSKPAATPKPSIDVIALSFFGDLKEVTRKPWLYKNVIARGEISSWIGPPGNGKSANLTDIAAHGGNGDDWRGYRSKGKFGTLYFAIERVDLVKRRFIAHRLRDELSPDLPIAISGDVLDVMNRTCVPRILDAIKRAEERIGCEVGLIGIDTWSKAIAAGGGEESAAKDQNIALANLRRVLEKVNIHIATIGHTGKDEKRGERGSNAKRADIDLEVQIAGDVIRTATVNKANDQQIGLLTRFQLEPFDFGPDEDGDPFRTYIVSKETFDGTAAPKTEGLSDKQKLALECLAEATLSYGVPLKRSDMPIGLKSVTADQWLDELHRRRVLDPKAANPRARFAELRTRLDARRLIGVDGELVWLASRP
jgi:hypothetical protein